MSGQDHQVAHAVQDISGTDDDALLALKWKVEHRLEQH
jgi:hypothetical protein